MPQFINETPFIAAPVTAAARFGESSGSLVVKATFDIVPGAPATPAKEQKPVSANATFMDTLGRSLAWPDDLVPYKPNTDFFVLGNFHQPGGVAAPQGHCAFRFGPLSKTLRIHGPRFATRAPAPRGQKPGDWTVTAAEPIAALPLRWELSLGGLRDPRNPFGLGGDPEIVEGVEVLRLPLIESMREPDRPDNFAPVPPIFAERRRKLGTRDQRWMLFRAPIPPDDFDPSHVNAAPADQQAGDSPRGDEAITLTNLHPTIPELTFLLPGLRIRTSVVRKTEQGAVGEEVAMRLDTVGVAPGEGKLILLWRGVVALPAGTDFDATIPLVLVAAEPVGAPAASPDPPARVLAAWRELEAVEAAKEAALEATARNEMKKLLPQAGLPAGIASLIETDADPMTIFDALEKHIQGALAEIEKMLPKP